MFSVHSCGRSPVHRTVLVRTAVCALMSIVFAGTQLSGPVAQSAEAIELTPLVTPTSWAALNRAIARIPNYRPGVATWTVTARFGHWGTTDVGNGRVYISPTVPASRLYSVVAHEYGHALASSNWGRNWRAADAAMNRWFGGGTALAPERAADCMARLQGATWTNYTTCASVRWRQGARILLAGRRLP